ncbi:MAG TPA: hypothetical protein V6C81_30750 [Planktothrix sp.]|jgi:hypothetical protein
MSRADVILIASSVAFAMSWSAHLGQHELPGASKNAKVASTIAKNFAWALRTNIFTVTNLPVSVLIGEIDLLPLIDDTNKVNYEYWPLRASSNRNSNTAISADLFKTFGMPVSDTQMTLIDRRSHQ